MPLDVYGGVLRLNPASTRLQWLQTLQLVTNDKLDAIRDNRAALQEAIKSVQGVFGVRLKKGFSCHSQEYFEFVMRLRSVHDAVSLAEGTEINSLILEPITVTVETPQACRRPIITAEGSIRLATSMSAGEVAQAVDRLGQQARKTSVAYQEDRDRCKKAIHQIQWELGLERVYRTKTVKISEFLGCLSRILLVSEAEQKHKLKSGLSGNSLGVTSSGHFCHLADDGSVVIPFDWQ